MSGDNIDNAILNKRFRWMTRAEKKAYLQIYT